MLCYVKRESAHLSRMIKKGIPHVMTEINLPNLAIFIFIYIHFCLMSLLSLTKMQMKSSSAIIL